MVKKKKHLDKGLIYVSILTIAIVILIGAVLFTLPRDSSLQENKAIAGKASLECKVFKQEKHDENGLSLCDGSYWQKCDQNNLKKNIGRYVCDGSYWQYCSSISNFNQNIGRYVCDGNSWIACSSLNKLSVSGPNICDGTNWQKCSSSNKLTVLGSNICDGTNWQKCSSKGQTYGSYTCDGTNWIYSGSGPILLPSSDLTNTYNLESYQKDSFVITTSDKKNLCTGNENKINGTKYCYKSYWFTCSGKTVGIVGNAYCNGKSWTLCDKKELRIDNLLCDGTSFISCNLNNNKNIISGYYCDENKWLSCSQLKTKNLDGIEIICDKNDKIKSVKELFCRDGIDNDFDGLIDCGTTREDPDCPSSLTIDDKTHFQATISRNSCKTLSITTPTYTDNLQVNRNIMSQIQITSTELLADSLDIEYRTSKLLPTDPFERFTIHKLSALKDTVEKPTYKQDLGLTFLFFDKNSFTVHLTKQLKSTLTYPKNVFVKNLLDGESLILEFNTEIYQITYPKNKDTFEASKIELIHLPSREIYRPNVVLGQVGKYYFKVKGNYNILIEEGLDYKISPISPSEAPLGAVSPRNLVEDFEAQFTLDKPIRIDFPKIGTLTICKEDRKSDLNNAIVCLNNNPLATLTRSELKKVPISNQDFAFLYEFKDSKKVVSIFTLSKPTQTAVSLSYGNFIDSMISGRRAALEFEKGLYLLDHGKSNYFSLLNLSLYSTFRRSSVKAYTYEGNEDKVAFDLTGIGKVILKRNEGTPPPPFDLTAITPSQQGAMDLSKELTISFTSTLPIEITNPIDFGTITVDQNDVTISISRLLLNSENKNIITLIKDKPIALQTVPGGSVSNTLIYYNNAKIENGVFKKFAVFYYLVNITKTHQSIPFNDEMIKKFQSGKKLAIKFEDSYYLLNYKGTGFFDINKFYLTDINGANPIVAKPVEGKIEFSVSEGDIIISEEGRRLTISKKLKEELITSPFEDFYMELTPDTKVTIQGKTFRMCYLNAYSQTTAAKICDEGNFELEINPTNKIFSGNEYIFESNKKTGLDKKVIIRKVINVPTKTFTTLPYKNDDWLYLIDKISNQKSPILNVSGSYFLLESKSKDLKDLTLTKYPYGNIYSLYTQQKTPITSNATTAIGDRILFFDQIQTKDENKPLAVEISLLEYFIIPADNHLLIIKDSRSTKTSITKFVAAIGGTPLTLMVEPRGPEKLLLIKMYEGHDIKTANLIFNKYMSDGNTKQFTIDGIKFYMMVRSSKTEYKIEVGRVK